MDINNEAWLEQVSFDDSGLIPAVAQDFETGRVLMVANMNRDSLLETARTGHATYWSRSRQAMWRKGESSGHQQIVHDIQLDCDGDVLVLLVNQTGGIACHTGRQSCFFRQLTSDGWQVTEPVLKDPREIYPDG